MRMPKVPEDAPEQKMGPDAPPPGLERPRAGRGRNPELEAAFGVRIRAARVAAGLTQTSLGAAVGVSFQQVQKYELGKDRIAASTLQNIAAALGVHPGTFYDETPTPAGSLLSVRAAVRIAERIQRVRDPNIVRRLVALIDLLAKAEDDGAGLEHPSVTSDESR